MSQIVESPIASSSASSSSKTQYLTSQDFQSQSTSSSTQKGDGPQFSGNSSYTPMDSSRVANFNGPRNRNPKRSSSDTLAALVSAMEVLQKEKSRRHSMSPRKISFLDHLAAVISPMNDDTYRELEYELRHTVEAFERRQTSNASHNDHIDQFTIEEYTL